MTCAVCTSIVTLIFVPGYCQPSELHSFPTRRSSDLAAQVADTYPRLHVLVNNVGGFWAHRHVTADGLEHTFALNHLAPRSEEHTSELQSHSELVCRLLLEKKNCAKFLEPYQQNAVPN